MHQPMACTKHRVAVQSSVLDWLVKNTMQAFGLLPAALAFSRVGVRRYFSRKNNA